MGFLLYSNTQFLADLSIWKCPIRWLFQSPFKKPPIVLYFTNLQSFAIIIFRSKNILLHTCLNVMEIMEKRKRVRINIDFQGRLFIISSKSCFTEFFCSIGGLIRSFAEKKVITKRIIPITANNAIVKNHPR